MTKSKNLNICAEKLTQAYQKTRDLFSESVVEIRKLVEELKAEKGYNWVTEHIYGN